MLSDREYDRLQRTQSNLLSAIKNIHNPLTTWEEEGPPPAGGDRTATTFIGGTCTTTQVTASSFLGQTTPFTVNPWSSLNEYIQAVAALSSDIPSYVSYDPLFPSTIQVARIYVMENQVTFSHPLTIGDSLGFPSIGRQYRPFLPELGPDISLLEQGESSNEANFVTLSTILAPLANMSRIYQYVTHTPSIFFPTMTTDSGVLRYPRNLTNTPCMCTRQILFTVKKGMYYAVTSSFFWTGDFPWVTSLEMAVYFGTSSTTPGGEAAVNIPRFYGMRLINVVRDLTELSVSTPPRIFLANADSVFITIASYYELRRNSGSHYCTGLITLIQI